MNTAMGHRSAKHPICALVAVLHFWSVASWAAGAPSNFRSQGGVRDAVPPVAGPILTHELPPTGVVVISNALGDIVEDGRISLLDILRMRDISRFFGTPPSLYERTEGDINRDGAVVAADLELLVNVLLQRVGPYHLMTSEGGEVRGSGISLHIPPNTIADDVLTARMLPTEDLQQRFLVDADREADDENYLMGAFEVKSTKGSPLSGAVTFSVTLDSLPPCEFDGFNGLFEVVDDMDADGRFELVLRNVMRPSADSTVVETVPTPAPELGSEGALAYAHRAPVEPGTIIEVPAANLASILEGQLFTFVSASGRAMSVPPLGFVPDNYEDFSEVHSLAVIVPLLDVAGPTNVHLTNMISGANSNAVVIDVAPLGSVTGDVSSVIDDLFASYDAVLGILAGCDSLKAIYPPMQVLLDRELPVAREEMANLRVLLEEFEVETQAPIARLIINSGVLDQLADVLAELDASWGCPSTNVGQSVQISQEGPLCGPGLGLQVAAGTVVVIVGATALFVPKALPALVPTFKAANGLYNVGRAMRSIGCGELPPPPSGPVPMPVPRPSPTPGDWGPVGQPDAGLTPTGGIGADGSRTAVGCCVNIYRYKQNLMGALSSAHDAHDSGGLRQLGSQSRTVALDDIFGLGAWESPLKGAIIRPMNVRAPYGVVGFVGAAGNWVIPSLPLNTVVTLGIFDPKTGLFDVDAATVRTGPAPGSFGFVLADFDPDVSFVEFPLALRNSTRDRIAFDRQRIDYRVFVSSQDLERAFNMGFCSEIPLSFKLIDPSGVEIISESSTSSWSGSLPISVVGTHTVRIGFSQVNPQESSFVFGTLDAPYYPMRFIGCNPEGLLADVLSPYEVFGRAVVSPQKALVVGQGQVVEFPLGASITAVGTVRGEATPVNPILLRPGQASVVVSATGD